MATAAVTTAEPAAIECTVCHEHFTRPKILPCGHLLCRACLVTWLHSQPGATCPLCRRQIVDPRQHRAKSCEAIADGFPTDLAMAALVKAELVRLSKPHECCVCVDRAAVDVCINCSDMFCASCSHVHTKQSATKPHTMERLRSLRAETPAAKCPATCGNMASQIGTRVRDLDLTSTLPPDVKDKSLVTLTVDGQAVSHIEQKMSTLGLRMPTFVFHGDHGANIRLSNGNRTAYNTSFEFSNHGIVMSRDPMLTGMLYQVLIEEADSGTDNRMSSRADHYSFKAIKIRGRWVLRMYSITLVTLGVVNESPIAITFPSSFKNPTYPSVLWVNYNTVCVFGREKKADWPVLKELQMGSTVGLAVYTDTSLHLYVDGKHQGVVAPFTPSRCFFMFELNYRFTKVTTLPLTPVP